VNVAHVAEWFRWIGVGVAIAGVLIATPAGVAETGRRLRGGLRKSRGWLAHYLPFLRRGATVHGVTANATIRMSGVANGYKWQLWEPDANDSRKIEVLHQQADILLEHVQQLRKQSGGWVDDVRSELRDVEVGLDSAQGKMTRQMEIRERQAAPD
jgi:hypothetical protein